MLDLIKRTGTSFGITVVVASHLLGEIEQVGTYLVAIDAGKLLRADTISSFTKRTPVLAVEVEEGADRLAQALDQKKLRTRLDGTRILVAINDDTVYDMIRDAVANLDLPLVRMQQERGRLEDLFRDAAPAAEGIQ